MRDIHQPGVASYTPTSQSSEFYRSFQFLSPLHLTTGPGAMESCPGCETQDVRMTPERMDKTRGSKEMNSSAHRHILLLQGTHLSTDGNGFSEGGVG